jgi:hypothetical protein
VRWPGWNGLCYFIHSTGAPSLDGNVIHRAFLVCVLLAAGSIAAGCSDSNTSYGSGETIRVQEMQFRAVVSATDSTSAAVEAQLVDARSVPEKLYRLLGRDELVACIISTCVTLRDTFPLAAPVLSGGYRGVLPYIPDEYYVISLSKATGTAVDLQLQASGFSANSFVKLSPPFEITSPADSEQVTDGSLIAVGWAPVNSGEQAQVETAAQCRHQDGAVTIPRSEVFDDLDGDGLVQVAVDEILQNLASSAQSAAPVRGCDIAIRVVYRRLGSVDGVFSSGTYEGDTARSVSVTYFPSSP